MVVCVNAEDPIPFVNKAMPLDHNWYTLAQTFYTFSSLTWFADAKYPLGALKDLSKMRASKSQAEDPSRREYYLEFKV